VLSRPKPALPRRRVTDAKVAARIPSGRAVVTASLGDAALRYAKRGWHVFPVYEPRDGRCSCGWPKCTSPAKHPRTPRGLLDATTDPHTITAWWQKWADASIGIATEPSGLVVLDVDVKSGGEESLEQVIATFGRVDDTMCVLTGGGGQHYFFAAGTNRLASRAAALGREYPGIDIRAMGGYVVAPPSLHITGRSYAWEASAPDTLEPVPAWLIAAVNELQRHRKTATAGPTDRIASGTRNNELTSRAGIMRRSGFSEQAIQQALRIENQDRCDPPLPEDEVDRIAASVSRYAPARAANSVAQAPADSRSLTIVDAADLLAKPYQPTEFLVDPIIPRVGTVLLSGDTGSAKTAFMIHVALSVAVERSVAGRFAVVRDSRPILFFNGEMGGALLRTYLHQAAAGIEAEIPKGRILFHGEDGRSQAQLSDFADPTLEELAARYSPAMIVIDTQRAMFGIDENETGAVILACNRLQAVAQSGQLVVVLSHHQRKRGPTSNSARELVAGSRHWLAGVDAHLVADSRNGRAMHALKIDKMRAPSENGVTGTEWPVEARLEMHAQPHRSIFAIGDALPAGNARTKGSIDDEADNLRGKLGADGPLTRAELGADCGNRKRAFAQLREAHEIVLVEKRGKQSYFGLAGVHDAPDFDSAYGVND